MLKIVCEALVRLGIIKEGILSTHSPSPKHPRFNFAIGWKLSTISQSGNCRGFSMLHLQFTDVFGLCVRADFSTKVL